MNKVWLKDFDEQQQKEFKAAVKSYECRVLIEKLVQILEEDSKAVNKRQCSADSFNGDWAFEQAVLVSQLKNNTRLLELLNSLLTKTK